MATDYESIAATINGLAPSAKVTASEMQNIVKDLTAWYEKQDGVSIGSGLTGLWNWISQDPAKSIAVVSKALQLINDYVGDRSVKPPGFPYDKPEEPEEPDGPNYLLIGGAAVGLGLLLYAWKNERAKANPSNRRWGEAYAPDDNQREEHNRRLDDHANRYPYEDPTGKRAWQEELAATDSDLEFRQVAARRSQRVHEGGNAGRGRK